MRNNKTPSKTNKKFSKILRLMICVLCVFLVCFLTFLVLKKTGVWEQINSVEKMKECVKSGGVFSFLIFIIFQILQTTILQIPAFIVTLVGALIFGKWQAFLMSYFAVMVGSLIMFWIGRFAGRKFLNWIVGKEDAEKWIKNLTGCKYLFFLMMIFPLFPDDILCVVAGITNMSFSFFFWTNIIARGIGIAATVFFGTGTIIPFSGWGLLVWGVLILMALTFIYISIKYKDKIDEIIKQIFKK